MATPDSFERRGGEILDAVRALQDSIREVAPEIEENGRLPEGIVEALKQANVFGMAMPRRLGGVEADPITQLEVVEALSIADGSVGWTAMIGSDGGFYAAHFPKQTTELLYADHNAITASTLVPRGRARIVPGGYCVTGHWAFGSASLHAEWFGGGCLVVDDEGTIQQHEGMPLVRTLFMPASDVTIHDNWQTTGLAGSGSNDWSVEDVFVPSDRSLSIFEKPRIDAPLFNYPWFIVATAPGVPLGIARASIDALCALAREKVTLPTGKKLEEDLLVQTAVGRAEAELGAARSYIYLATAAIFNAVVSGREPSIEERANFRLAGLHSFRASKSVVSRMYEAGGGSALYRSSPLDRHWRDISTVSQHAFASESGYGEGGRAMMGLDPQSPML